MLLWVPLYHIKRLHLIILIKSWAIGDRIFQNDQVVTYSQARNHYFKAMTMSFWQIFGRFAVSDTGESIQKLSDTTSVSSDGTTYTKMGSTTVGSDGSVFTQMGTVRGTSGNVNDVTEANSLRHGQESVVFGDAGYQGVEKRTRTTLRMR